MTQGIYTITHKPSGRRYIGASEHIEVRWYQHQCQLKAGRHHNSDLQSTWDISQETDFSFDILVCIDDPQLLKINESKYILAERNPFNSVAAPKPIVEIYATHEYDGKVTVIKAANILNVDESYIRRLIQKGKLEAVRFGSMWLVNKASVEAYAQTPRRAGHPKKQKE